MKKAKVSKYVERKLQGEMMARVNENKRPVSLPDSKEGILASIASASGPQLEMIKKKVVNQFSGVDKSFCMQVIKAANERMDAIKANIRSNPPMKTPLQERRYKIAREKKSEEYHQTHPIRIEYTPMGGQNGKTHH